MAKLFGTDGVRGIANRPPVAAETMLRLGMAAGHELSRQGHGRRAVIGKDTRLSGYMVESALTSGLVAIGMDPILVGPLPTPAIAMLTRTLRADLGIMVTASHNTYEYNGVKLFGPDGAKLGDQAQERIEERMSQDPASILATSGGLGRARRLDDARGRYMEFVKQSFPRGLTLEGVTIVIDCANGAAYQVAPEVLWELGAEVIPIGVEPDGTNINAGCGSTCPKTMRAAVIENEADFGMTLDGDADRVLVADETGALVDGDQIIALIARSWQSAGTLRGGGVAATVISSMGLERALGETGLRLERTPVGDRHVAQCMREKGLNLGGEPSGHVILGEHATTGDGLTAALQVLAAIVASGRPASAVCRVFDPVAQVSRNVRVSGKGILAKPALRKALAAGKARLGEGGRLLVRESGTEPVVRILAEGESPDLIGAIVADMVAAVERHAGTAGADAGQPSPPHSLSTVTAGTNM